MKDDKLNFEEIEIDKYIEGLGKDEIPIPAEFDKRVNERIKALGPKKHYIRNTIAACAAFCILFVGGVKLSPGFAAYASSIPGIGKAVEWLEGDSGIKNARDHGYREMNSVTVEENGYILSLDNIMLDEDRMHFSLVVTGKGLVQNADKGNEKPLRVGEDDPLGFKDTSPRVDVRLPDFKNGGIHQSFDGMKEGYIASKVERQFRVGEVQEFLSTSPKFINIEVSIMKGRELVHSFSNIQIPLNDSYFMASKVYDQNKELTVDKLSFTISRLTVSPTRMRIDYSSKMQEGYTFSGFENPYIKDDKGNIYKPEGLISSYSSDEERNIYFVPSIYFDKLPKELYFCFDGIRIASDEGRRFTLSLNDVYPKTVEYMGQPIEIQEFSYTNNKNLVIECLGPDENILRIQGISTIEGRGSNSWSSYKDEESGKEIVHITSILEVEKQEVYEVQFDHPGYLIDEKFSMKLKLD